MNRLTLFLLILLFSSKIFDLHADACTNRNQWMCTAIDFDESMKMHMFAKELRTTQLVFGIDGAIMSHFYKKLYVKNNPHELIKLYDKNNIPFTLKIPKIIHQIWIGSPVPTAFIPYMQTWKDMHPDWQYILWTDENIHLLHLYNQEFFDKTDNPGVKSDLLKWEIVYQYGGVYVDVDFECLRSLDMFHYLYDFYTGLQPLDTQFLQLGAALFGAIPHHPILKHCIETIKDDWHHKGAPTKSGPVHFTKSFYQKADCPELINIAFPASYFYPLGCRQSDYAYQEWLNNGAFAIHHWAKSWMPNTYRPMEFRHLGNEHSTQSWNN
jgi:mannosyltransferase OCH1-like enzyme